MGFSVVVDNTSYGSISSRSQHDDHSTASNNTENAETGEQTVLLESSNYRQSNSHIIDLENKYDTTSSRLETLEGIIKDQAKTNKYLRLLYLFVFVLLFAFAVMTHHDIDQLELSKDRSNESTKKLSDKVNESSGELQALENLSKNQTEMILNEIDNLGKLEQHNQDTAEDLFAKVNEIQGELKEVKEFEIHIEGNQDAIQDEVDALGQIEKQNEERAENLSAKVNEMQSKVDTMKPIVNSLQQNVQEIERSKLLNEVKAIMEELRGSLKNKHYFSTFQWIVDSWVTSALETEKEENQIDLSPMFFHISDQDYPNGYNDIEKAGKAFSNVLQKLKIKSNNKFVYKWTKEKSDFEDAFKRAQNGVYFVPEMFYYFRESHYIEYILKGAKDNNILLMTAERQYSFSEVKTSISKMPSLLKDFKIFDL